MLKAKPARPLLSSALVMLTQAAVRTFAQQAVARPETGEGVDTAVRGIDRAFQAQPEDASSGLIPDHQARDSHGQLSLSRNITPGSGVLFTPFLLFLVVRR